MSNDPKRFLRYLSAERNASMLYRALAETTDGERREALLELADIEDKHAEHWVEKLDHYGVEIPPPPAELEPGDAQLVTRARSLGLSPSWTPWKRTRVPMRECTTTNPKRCPPCLPMSASTPKCFAH